tara:strand:+ start:13973 stop:15649 length:1677 start_codon:yes stop_codon:yes gene_type:complete
MNDIKVIKLNNYVKPIIQEIRGKDWILNGHNNSYFDYVYDRSIGSPTNATILNGYRNLYYGRGLKARDAARKPLQFAKLLTAMPNKEMRKVISDYAVQFNAAFQVIPNKNGTKTARYIDIKKLAFDKVDEEGEVNGFWYSSDWSDIRQYAPTYFPKYGKGNGKEIEIIYINKSQDDSKYYSLPEYQSGLQYAEMEEEISNYYINHIKNGFSYGYIVNMNNGVPADEEQREEIERRIKAKMTGSSNAGNIIISFNEGKEASVEIVPLEVSDSHKQWESINKQSEEKLMRSHGVVSPVLFGIKDNSGLGNNAQELQTALSLTMDMRINPEQDVLIDAITPFLMDQGITLDLYFEALNKQEEAEEQGAEVVETTTLSKKKNDASELYLFIESGEYEDLENYNIVDENEVDYNEEVKLASTGVARPRSKSEQDSSDISIRYRYVGNKNPEREFCKKMMQANKVYRKEDIEQLTTKPVNKGFGLNGAATYSIWLYKGGGLLSDTFPGGTCKHKWNRVIYLKKGVNVDPNSPLAEIISTSEARKRGYKLPKNDSLVSIAPHDNK